MKESTLKAILRLYAISCNLLETEEECEIPYKIISEYILQYTDYSNSKRFFQIFEYYYKDFKNRLKNKNKYRDPLFSVKTVIICEQIKNSLLLAERIKILLTVIQFFSFKNSLNQIQEDFIKTIGVTFNISPHTLHEIEMFILKNFEELHGKQNILVFKQIEGSTFDNINIHQKVINNLRGEIYFLLIHEIKTILFFYQGPNNYLYLGSKHVIPSLVYMLDKGDVIYNPLIGSIHYGDILKEFFKQTTGIKVELSAINLEYKFSDNKIGIYPFSFYAESGQLVGIMGSSGAGKTTLINLLNGNLKPSSGSVLVNGHVLHDNEHLRSIMGYVPQEDLLIEELTVFENLYYNTKLCFGNLTDKEIINRIDNLLFELDLIETRNLKVGNVLNKFISGGQRKRLNIALELIREPLILFVDEPTSGLSSNDSLMVMELLKELTYKGILIIVNIHQPSSDVFKLFDKLMVIDRGGRVIYYGNPLEAITYFKNYHNLIDSEKTECTTCGNLNPELILEIVEAKEINEHGFYTDKRIVSPEEWYNSYKKNIEPFINKEEFVKKQIPENSFKPPNIFNQFKIYLKRNISTKIADVQYIFLNLLETPLLAFILSIFIKYQSFASNGNIEYIFSKNINIPIYLFMSVVVALFIGMMISAEEIIKDRKILKRESFLNLSSFSYYNSKVFYLLIVSAYQTLAFVIVGNLILRIKGMYISYWLILFSIAVFANILGLIISDNLKSVVSIYISIPLLLIPQILFGGSMIKFDKLNRYITSQEYVPIIGDIMVSRWAYEALAVNQFINNKYEKNFYSLEKQESDAYYYMNILIPELESKLQLCSIALREKRIEKFYYNLKIIKNEVNKLINYYSEIPSLKELNYVNDKNFGKYFLLVSNYFDKIKMYFSRRLDLILKKKDEIVSSLEIEYGGKEKLQKLKNDYYNEELANIVLAKYDRDFIVEYKNEIIRKIEPIFNYPDSKIGRAHMFSPVKRIGNFFIDTFYFNLLFIWFINLLFYLILVNKVIQRINLYFINLVTDIKQFINN